MSTLKNSPGYGSFADLCLQATLPVCNLFPPAIQPTCALKSLGTVSNLGNILFSCGALSILVLILIRMSRKLAAVGRKEMMILYSGIAVHLCLQMVTTSNVLSPDSIHLVRISSFHLAWTFALFYMLFFNGIVGFQYWRDGSRLSMMLISIGSLGFVIGLTTLNISRAETYLLSSSSKSLATLNDTLLYTLYVTWPILASFLFLVSQFVLVLRSLSARLPLVYLTLAFVLLGTGQAVHFLGSSSICLATDKVIDGAIFSSAFLLLSSLSLFKFWSDITEDDWDDFKLTL